MSDPPCTQHNREKAVPKRCTPPTLECDGKRMLASDDTRFGISPQISSVRKKRRKVAALQNFGPRRGKITVYAGRRGLYDAFEHACNRILGLVVCEVDLRLFCTNDA